MEDAGDEEGGADACCVVDVKVSVVRSRVVVKEEGRKSRRLGATVAVRNGIWRNMTVGCAIVGALTQDLSRGDL